MFKFFFNLTFSKFKCYPSCALEAFKQSMFINVLLSPLHFNESVSSLSGIGKISVLFFISFNSKCSVFEASPSNRSINVLIEQASTEFVFASFSSSSE